MTEVTVKIENTYSDGHESESLVKVDAPPSADDGDLVAWFNEVVFDHTGDGHGQDASVHSHYQATIVDAADPQLVGEWFEWV